MYHLPNIPDDAKWKPLSGGSINEVFRIFLTDGSSMVVKVNRSSRYPGMFAYESEGLNRLRPFLRVPQVNGLTSYQGNDFLLLEDLGDGMPSQAFYTSLGEQLANMHLDKQSTYGLDHDNYIGSLPQSNVQSDDWGDFFINQRLRPLVKSAYDKGLLNRNDVNDLESLSVRFNNLYPKEYPSLLHGDLWSGNVHCGTNGTAYFIDPAIYCGHREMDLAMTKMFGGFDKVFYDAYQAVYPLEKGWEHRITLWNTYPNLVHLNLFGNSYVQGVRQGLNYASTL